MNMLKIEQTQNGNNKKIGQGSKNVKHAISERTDNMTEHNKTSRVQQAASSTIYTYTYV